MIDKSSKLQRYDRKDYSELVEFPVEIVGRDGLVRRYTFEDSIRLYQRRITFAPIRFRDSDLVRAEVGHCRSRIGQLRRSYFHRFGWGTPAGEPDPEELFDGLAGEVAAFLCRVLRVGGRPELHFESVREQAGVLTFFVTPRGAMGMLLYVHRFDGPQADRVREAFFAQLKELESVNARDEGDSERLLAFHHTVDCGFVLAGRGNELDDVTLGAPDAPMPDLSPTPFEEVIELVRRGDFERALVACQSLVQDQPWHLNAYSLGAVLALHLNQPHAAEDLAAIGNRYFREDGHLLWCLGLARLRQGRVQDAEMDLRLAGPLLPDVLGPRLALIGLLLRQRRTLEARVALEAAARSAGAADPEQGHVARSAYRAVSFQYLGISAGSCLAGVGLVAVASGLSLGAVATSLGALTAAGAWLVARHHLRGLQRMEFVEDLPDAVRRIQERLRKGPQVS